MRAQVLNTIAGALGLAAVVASAPAALAAEDCSAPSIATVFVTVPASSIDPSTVYVTLPVSSVEVSLSEIPTTTMTRYATLYSTATDPYIVTEYLPAASSSVQAHAASPYDPTITEIATVTVTNVHLTPLGGSSVTYTETPAPNGLLNYVVENGTTYWLDGQTPAPGGSYVYSTSSITIVPVYDSTLDSEQPTSTLTLQTTLYVTAQFTLTETLSTAPLSSSEGVVISAGTGLPYTMGPGGWNATKTSCASGYLPGTTGVSSKVDGVAASSLAASAGFAPSGSPSLVLYSSFDIYKTSHSTISISSLAAESGFYAFSTTRASGYASTTPSDPRATSSAKVAPYGNSTFATSVRASSGASGALTSLSSTASGIIGYGPSSASINSTTLVSSGSLLSASLGYTSTTLPDNCSTASSSALGALTSSVPSGGLSSSLFGYTSSALPANSSTASSFASSIPSGTVGYTSSSVKVNSTSSALGVLTYATTTSSSYDPNGSSSLLGYTSSSKTNISTASSSALGALTSATSTIKSSATFSAGSYSYSLPAVSSTASSSTLGVSASLSSSTSDDCTDSTSSTQLSVTASSSASGVLTSLSSSTAELTSTSSLPIYTSSVVVNSTSGSSYSASTSPPLYSSTLKPSSTLTTKTSTNVSSSVYVTPTSCGEQGNFVLNFDDIPPLGVPANDTDVQPEPVFNPYHQFDFSDGFTVVPAPKVPYNPSSPHLFVEFIQNFNINGTNTQAGPNTAEEGYNGQISDGDFDQTGCFRFNVYGASMGCDSTGPPCDFTFAGYRLDSARNEVLVTTQTKAVQACPALSNCSLVEVDLDYDFTNLAFVRINATVAGEPKTWWMDDLRLGWYDNSCAMGLCRQSTHVH